MSKKIEPVTFTENELVAFATILDVFIMAGGLDLLKRDRKFLRNGISLIEKLGLAAGEFTPEKLQKIKEEEGLFEKEQEIWH